ncbi:homoaconitate hydratase family protein [Candidatus Gottesmanbacteria bacterium]|nr:homoaconitate hydratase family protein [Candidatus Gottesmanbacteria bacterium]
MEIKGIVSSIFPDNINTDDIIPAWTLQESLDQAYFKKYAFYNYDPDFVARCKNNRINIIVAGKNFGCGSSREQAVYALKKNGVAVIIAESFSNIFYRNALNNGLLLITVNNISLFKLQDKLEINLKKNIVLLKNQIIPFKISNEDIRVFSLGGKLCKVKNHLNIILTKKTNIKNKHPKQNFSSVKSQTIVEKIISDHLGKSVFAGNKIEMLPIDILFFNEVIGPVSLKYFCENFSDIYTKHNQKIKVFNPKRIFFVLDHSVPSSSIAVSEGISYMKSFAQKQGIHCYKEGDGIEHVVLMEDGFIIPGQIIMGTDSHTSTNGALNTLAFGVGTSDAAYALATGYLYNFEIPQTIRIDLIGKFPAGVYAKDFILYLISQLGADGANRRIVEFGGQGLKAISMDGRCTIANMTVEMGARSAIFDYDQVLEKYVNSRANFSYKPYLPDKNCNYEKEININLSNLEPCVSFPHKPGNITFISQIKDYLEKNLKPKTKDFARIHSLKITNAFLGSCTNGRYEDFLEAAKILKGNKVHKNVNFIAIPASRRIYNQLMKERILDIFSEAGVNIESSNCGPCFGKHMGVLGRDAQIISSSNRNYTGRMGSPEAKIFLASPATVAASALAGEIVDPRKYLLK